MQYRVSCLALCLCLGATALYADERVTLGFGRLFNNDALGDGTDRWRTGSYTVSWVRGPGWDGELPKTFGTLIETRFGAEIITPADISDPAPGDRRYVGALTLGLHSHALMARTEVSAGINLVFTGPQTGLGNFQENVHGWFDMESPEVLDDQIPNGVHPTLLAEVGRSYALGKGVTVRPFAEAQAGVETYLRLGGDVAIGDIWSEALMLRDSSTGQRYVGIRGFQAKGLSFSLGGDIAQVYSSAYLPDDEPAVLSDSRARLRAGMHWQGRVADVFYGLTWLGHEFEDQPETQVVGSLRINIDF